jgi:hypothetical protein
VGSPSVSSLLFYSSRGDRVARWRLLDWLIPFYCMYVDARSSVFRTGWQLFLFFIFFFFSLDLLCVALACLVHTFPFSFSSHDFIIITTGYILATTSYPSLTHARKPVEKKTYVSMSRNDQNQCQHYDQNLLPHTSHVHFPACDRPVAACGVRYACVYCVPRHGYVRA